MENAREFDRLFGVAGNGIQQYVDDRAVGERIQEWFDTPMGTMLDKPWWGSPLRGYQHDPQGANLAVMIEAVIVRKLPQDVRDVAISGVRVNWDEIDRVTVDILFRSSFGTGASSFILL